MPSLRLLSYNIHKGFNLTNQRFVLQRIREAVVPLGADFLFLQEVVGEHSELGKKHAAWPEESQFEFLAHSIWPHFTYGKNSIYTEGHHGNAILSKHPISYWEHQPFAHSSFDQKGLLHAAVKVPGLPLPLHLICVHLSLLGFLRKAQLEELCARVEKVVPAHAPLIVAGDFNDWSEKASAPLEQRLALKEACLETSGRHAVTFPSLRPLLRLDRVYFRGLRCVKARCIHEPPWNELSDHLPLFVELE